MAEIKNISHNPNYMDVADVLETIRKQNDEGIVEAIAMVVTYRDNTTPKKIWTNTPRTELLGHCITSLQYEYYSAE